MFEHICLADLELTAITTIAEELLMKTTLSSNPDPIEDVSTLKQKIRELEQSAAESERTEKALRESETMFRFLSENMVDIAFIVGMDLQTTYVSPSIERTLGFTPEERKNQNVEEQMTPQSLNLAFERLAEELRREEEGDADPDRSGTLNLDYYHKDGSVITLETNFRGVRDSKGTLTGFYGLSRDITDRKYAEEELNATLKSLRKALGAIVQIMVSIMETRDPYTAGHQLRVADLARTIATEMELPKDKIELIRIAGSIHDIGKLFIPAEILSKPAKLSKSEVSIIREHPRKGYELLKNIKHFELLGEIIYQHHERMDGSGYPRKLKGDDILTEARILAVADVVEAMASHRPYRPALGLNAALDEIRENRGTRYDSDIVDVCLKLFREKNYHLTSRSMI